MKRAIKIIGATVVLLLVAFLLFPFIYGPIWEMRARKDSIRILARTDAKDELASESNLFLTFPDESWIAIRYRDLHAGGVHSTSIARDSGGQWYESSRHFCALIDGYRSSYEMYRLERELGETEDFHVSSGFDSIHAVAMAPSLVSAREELIKMGFHPLNEKDAQQAAP
jgi:hypothetical protein